MKPSEIPAEQRREHLAELCEAFGPSGFEEEIATVILKRLESMPHKVWRDALGTIYVECEGRRPENRDRKLQLDAHMDEIGLIVQHVTEDGFLTIDTIGGWVTRVIPAQAALVKRDNGALIEGIVGSKPPHVQTPEEKKRAAKKEELFIDIGAASEAEVTALGIQIGSPIVLPGRGAGTWGPNGDHFTARNLDDRAGCAIQLEILEALAKEPAEMTVVASFSIAEEIGLRGATVAARKIQPEIALALESTIAGDVRGSSSEKRVTYQRRGAAIAVADRRMIFPSRVITFIEKLAAANGLPCQRKQPLFGGTDAGAIQVAASGVLVGCLAVPSRYIHSPNQQILWSDYEATADLAHAFTYQAHELLPE